MPSGLAELKQIALVNTLRSCQLFTGLPQADLESIAAVTVVKSLEKGDYLFHEGDVAHGFYVVQRGAINVHRVNAAGKEQVIHVFRAGDSFAEIALASDTGYPADARAIEPSQVLLIQKAGILDLLKRRPELALRMLGVTLVLSYVGFGLTQVFFAHNSGNLFYLFMIAILNGLLAEPKRVNQHIQV